jgi:hypothetical protein
VEISELRATLADYRIQLCTPDNCKKAKNYNEEVPEVSTFRILGHHEIKLPGDEYYNAAQERWEECGSGWGYPVGGYTKYRRHQKVVA